MADREFVFGNEEIQKLINEKFVPLAMDDFYLRRQDDAAGKFFRKVADQGPRKGEGGATRQGRYVFTVDGVLLGYNNNRSPERMLAMLNDSLAKLEAVKPSANHAPEGSTKQLASDPRFERRPPEDGAVIGVFTRVLEWNEDGTKLQKCSDDNEVAGRFRHRGFGAALDYLWIRKDEITALEKAITESSKSGESFPFPEPLASRIARFHLADNTRGEPPHWRKEEIREQIWTCTPSKDGDLKIEIAGGVHLETADSNRGFMGKAMGSIVIVDSRVEHFDMVVIGDFWGEGRYTRGARPGRNPIGFVFTQIPVLTPQTSIPPQGARWLQGYYQADQ